ncbi:hypothetical protein H4W23_00750 [Streptomyces gardneri]|uniref:hypothetical protein n=1 Tax=Streptomyces gardneri TaxID=66892 RepID=UPI0006BCB79C|nr:hypothetical protein [Streptomyces gardneri]QPK43317.1 hypothetical protein H4W23_00750 [Streptomyces gardneri]WRK34540.1 hypothetical protein U0M97_00740 [Streptomyces venezuelae]CUM44052.1 hypothetical protein BN2537_17069 [Streptomyces venezuelae]
MVVAVGVDGQVVTASPLGVAIIPEGEAQGGFGTKGGVALDFGTTEQSLSAVLVEADCHVVVVSTAGEADRPRPLHIRRQAGLRLRSPSTGRKDTGGGRLWLLAEGPADVGAASGSACRAERPEG